MKIIQADTRSYEDRVYGLLSSRCAKLIDDIVLMDNGGTPMENVDYKQILELVISESDKIAAEFSDFIKDKPTLTTALLYYAISNLRIYTSYSVDEIVTKYFPSYKCAELGSYPTNSEQVASLVIKVKNSRCTIC